ncbi:MAG: hypothetical protein IJ600_10910 [Lachnospiraceae bacterium]|nr:hypothetical protein [Lachnospiraceae bacterium]
MVTTYELQKRMKGFVSGHTEEFLDIYRITADDMYYQLQFIICDEAKSAALLEEFFYKLPKLTFETEPQTELAGWLNEKITQVTTRWLQENRSDMVRAEQIGLYIPPNSIDRYLPGIELSQADFTHALAERICNLPELYRQTALAYYYNSFSAAQLSALLEIDNMRLRKRIEFIEKTLFSQMQDYCYSNKVAMSKLDMVAIRMALIYIQQYYSYENKEAFLLSLQQRFTKQ